MPDIELPHTSRGRLHPSAQASPGMVLLVPRPVIDEEQQQLMQMIVDARVQQLIIHLRRGGIKHLDVNEMLQRGEYKGFTPMHVAVMRGTSSIVAALLELANADPDVKAVGTGETPLHLAAAKGDVSMTRALLSHAANPDPHEKHGLTPLLVAAAAGIKGSFHHVVIAELLRAGASLSARDPHGDTPLHLACDSLVALTLMNELTAHRGSANLCSALEALNAGGESVLHRAIGRHQTEVAALLLQCGARADVRSSAGDTPMHYAARDGLETIAKLLLNEMKDATSSEARTRSLNASNLQGETALHLAMSGTLMSHARVAKLLLDHGAFAFGRTRGGESVLHVCAREGNVELARTVMRRLTPATVEALNAKSASGNTALHVAVLSQRLEMVALLLEQPQIDRGAVDHEGNTAIHLACQQLSARTSADTRMLALLLGAGRGVRAEQLTPRNNLGWAPLHTCAFHGTDQGVRLLLEHIAPVNQPTADGWTALQLAASEGHAAVTRSLLAASASADLHHPSGESALGLAAARSHHAVVRELLTAGASPATPVDVYGWTPMHAALGAGDEAVALALLERGGRLRAKKAPPARDAWPKPNTFRSKPLVAGDAIDRAPAELRSRLREIDERMRRAKRLEGHDSEDEEEDGEEPADVVHHADAWASSDRRGAAPDVAEAQAIAMLPAQVLLPLPLPYERGGPYEPLKRVIAPDRSGYFGAF